MITKLKRDYLKHYARTIALAAGLAVCSAQALTTTQTFDLGTSPAGTNFPETGTNSLVVWIPKGSLPVGSILRSVTATNVKLETANGSWASDLGVFVDPTPETPGGDGLLKIGADSNYGGSANQMNWNGGDNDGPFTDTRTEADWTGAIDLNNAAVMLGNGWSNNTVYSGTITVEYDISTLTLALTSPTDTQAYPTGTSITATATVVDPGNFTDIVTFHVTPISPAGPPVETVSLDTSSPFSTALGILPDGTYEIYATLVNDDDPPGTATSATHTFTVEAAIPTTTELAAAGAPTTYGDNVTFTATVSPTPTGGTVQFFDGANYLGSPVAVNTGTGEATYSTTTLGAGTREITAEYSGYQIYVTSTTAASISQEVGQAPLTVRALNTLRAPNTANPDPFPYQITGYQNDENLATSGVTGEPTLTTDALLASPADNYDITCALGSLAAPNYSFTLVNGTLTVADVADTFSVNFYFSGPLNGEQVTANLLLGPSIPAGFGDWLTSGWSNFEVPWAPSAPLDPVTLTSNQGSTATFTFKDCRNGWTYGSSARTTLLGDGNGNLMDSQVNSTLDGESNKFDMEITGIPFATYDVIFYMGGTQAQYGDGTGVIKFNGGAERAYLLQPGGFTGTFTEMVDAETPGNYIVFTGVTGSSFTAQTWGTGLDGLNHNGPTGFQIREAVSGSDYDTWLGEFTFAEGADTTPTGDPDGDGMTNQEEYAFGLNPTLGSSVNPIVSPLDPATGNFQYTRRATPAATGIAYNVLTSTTLAGWAAGGATETGFTTDGNIETVTVNVTAPPVDGKLFVRVQAVPTP